MFRLRHASVTGFPRCGLASACLALRPIPPSSNRTCGFPASGSPGNSRLGHTQKTERLHRPHFLLRLSAQLLSQRGEFPGFASSSVAGLVPKRLSLLIDRNMFPVRPLRSTGITPLLHYYEPVRLPFGTTPEVMSSLDVLRLPPHPHGPPRFLDQSFGTRHPQSPRRA